MQEVRAAVQPALFDAGPRLDRRLRPPALRRPQRHRPVNADALIAQTRAPMALTATIYNFDIELADADRNLYESLSCGSRATRRSRRSISSRGCSPICWSTRTGSSSRAACRTRTIPRSRFAT